MKYTSSGSTWPWLTTKPLNFITNHWKTSQTAEKTVLLIENPQPLGGFTWSKAGDGSNWQKTHLWVQPTLGWLQSHWLLSQTLQKTVFLTQFARPLAQSPWSVNGKRSDPLSWHILLQPIVDWLQNQLLSSQTIQKNVFLTEFSQELTGLPGSVNGKRSKPLF